MYFMKVVSLLVILIVWAGAESGKLCVFKFVTIDQVEPRRCRVFLCCLILNKRVNA